MALAAARTSTTPPGRPSRWAMFRQSFVAFATVLACYWVYWFLVVPLIEPSVEQRLAQNVTEEQIGRAREEVSLRQRELASYFHPDDWEATSPKFFNSGQTWVLFDLLRTGDEGIVELEPCTLMFFPSENPDRPGQPVIMRTAKARLQFDGKVDMRTVDAEERKFLGGEIEGAVRIVQRESAPGAGDDLEITTSGVKMDAQRIYTPEAVNFRFGRSRGFGRDLEIRLASSESGAQGTALRGMSVSSLELKREVQMVLEQRPPAEGASAAGAPRQAETIRITCSASFQFDMQAYSASFHQNVDLLRLNPTGESDQLSCQLLTVYFARPGEDARPAPSGGDASSGAAESPAQQIRLIEARGNPVTVWSPSRGVYANCRSGLDYLPGTGSEPGSMVALGPGVIKVESLKEPQQQFEASWAREMRFEPDGALHRASLHGGVMMTAAGLGDVTADEVFVWMSRKPRPASATVAQVAHQEPAAAGARAAEPAGSEEWQLERVVARRYESNTDAQSQGNVRIDSPQLDAKTGLLEAIVVRPQAAAPGAIPPAAEQPAPQRRRPEAAGGEKFFVEGGAVQIQLVPDGEEMTIASATIDRDAVLKQMQFAGGLEKRLLLVKGNRLHVTEAHTPATRITITGDPGLVEAEGMSLWGATIELEKNTSRLWIPGPGQLMLPVTQDLDGQPLARPQSLTVDWKQGMNFQKDTAVFTGKVVARSSQQVVNAETLEAVLNRPVDFANAQLNSSRPHERLADRLDLASVRTRGWTFLEGRQLDEQGQQTSFSQMGVNDLAIERTSGDIAGSGPGWVKHVTLGAPEVLEPSAAAGQEPPPKKPQDDDKLTYLHVKFRRGISGNLNRREVKFFDQTRTIYGPVDQWSQVIDDVDLANLGPSGMSLQADALEVREMGNRPDSKRGYFELDATGNVAAEGQRFTARGEQMTYAERNDQLTLRGRPAELFVENEQGGERREMQASLLQYWFKDHRASVNGARSLSFPFSASSPPPKQ